MDNETIKKYLSNQLSPIDRNAFEQEMENDPFLKESVEGWSMNDEQLTMAHLNSFEKEIHERIDTKIFEQKKSKVLYMNVFKFAAAACVFGILCAVAYRVIFTNKNVDEQKIYTAYFKPLTNTDVTVRGENDTTDEAKAAQAYEKEDYFEALNLYQKLVANNPNNVKNNLFLGISFLATNQEKRAIDVLSKITQSEEFHFDIQWYLALSYIKNKELQNALATLNNLTKEENYYQKEAQEIIDKLDGKIASKD